jgi:hypothetical protein
MVPAVLTDFTHFLRAYDGILPCNWPGLLSLVYFQIIGSYYTCYLTMFSVISSSIHIICNNLIIR